MSIPGLRKQLGSGKRTRALRRTAGRAVDVNGSLRTLTSVSVWRPPSEANYLLPVRPTWHGDVRPDESTTGRSLHQPLTAVLAVENHIIPLGCPNIYLWRALLGNQGSRLPSMGSNSAAPAIAFKRAGRARRCAPYRTLAYRLNNAYGGLATTTMVPAALSPTRCVSFERVAASAPIR